MRASIRIKIMRGTGILYAYETCADVSERLGGISVETSFNGVEMFYHNQPFKEWEYEYVKQIYGLSKEEGAE